MTRMCSSYQHWPVETIFQAVYEKSWTDEARHAGKEWASRQSLRVMAQMSQENS